MFAFVVAKSKLVAKDDGRVDAARVSEVFARLFIGVDGVSLRREDVQKVAELTGLIALVGRVRAGGVLVDAAAGKGSVALVAAEVLGIERVCVIERNPAHVALVRAAATRMTTRAEVTVHEADVDDAGAWPDRPDLVVALHACGPASDRVLDAAVRVRARRLLLVPCCYAEAVPFASRAAEIAASMGIPRHAEVRRRAIVSLIDAERTLRLEAAGYETVVSSFVAPTVTPHNLAWRARWSGEPRRIAEATEALARLRG